MKRQITITLAIEDEDGAHRVYVNGELFTTASSHGAACKAAGDEAGFQLHRSLPVSK